jgi:uncharacterized membrane protein required for colicin V production
MTPPKPKSHSNRAAILQPEISPIRGKRPAQRGLAMLLAALPPIASHTRFDYFDIVALDWLILGLFQGRRRGVSRELLPLLQWIAIVIAAGTLYSDLSPLIHQNTYLSVLWSNISAYLLIAAVVHLVYLWFSRMFAVKLVEMNLFGRREYYFGMIAGTARFTCILLFGLALMNSCFAPAMPVAKLAKPKKSLSGLHFPTYAELEQDVLSNSFSGNWVQSNLKPVLIASAKPPQPKIVPKKNEKAPTTDLASQTKIGAVVKNSR